MIEFKTHTAVIQPIVQGTDANHFLTNPTQEPASSSVPATVLGYLEPRTPSTALQQWGVETTAPAVFLCDLEDAGSWPLEAEVTIGSQLFTIAAPVKRWEGGEITDHCEILLDSLEFAKP